LRINDVISDLTSTYNEWDQVLANRSFVRRENIISWNNYIDQRHPDIIRRSDVAELERLRQYSFQVIDDGSIFQLYYDFQNNGVDLNSASLAYFSTGGWKGVYEEYIELSPHGKSFEINSDPTISEMTLFSVPDDLLVPWLRIDYSPKEVRGPLHHSCHMHIGLFQSARIPLTGIPTPHQFVEFIIALCYPEQYRDLRLGEDSNYKTSDIDRLKEFRTRCFVSTNGQVFDILPHIQVPSR
jgi:hypothetical protein